MGISVVHTKYIALFIKWAMVASRVWPSNHQKGHRSVLYGSRQHKVSRANICCIRPPSTSGIPRNFVRGGSTNSVEDRAQRTGIWGRWPPTS